MTQLRLSPIAQEFIGHEGVCRSQIQRFSA